MGAAVGWIGLGDDDPMIITVIRPQTKMRDANVIL